MSIAERRKRQLLVTGFVTGLLCFLTVGSAALGAPMLEDIRQWHQTMDLPDQLADGRTLLHNGHLFVVGGKEGGATNKVRVAKIGAEGSLGAWTSTATLPTGVYAHAVVASANHIYVIGGYDGANVRNEVWRAAFNGDSSLNAWQKIGEYPQKIVMHDAVVIGNRIYVAGGTSGTAGERTNKVYSVAVVSNGDLGAWREERNLPLALYRLSATAHVDHIYVTGGYDGNQRSDKVYYAQVNGDGSLGSWQAAAMPEPREYHQALVHDGRLVILGGRNSADELRSVRSAVIQPDGSLSGWSNEPDLPRKLYRFGAVTAQLNGSDSIYILGGLSTDNDDYRDEVYRSDIAPDPTASITPTSTYTPTPTQTPSPTFTPTSMTTGFPLYLPLTQNKLPAPDTLTFGGFVVALEDGPLVGFQHVQVHGSNEPDYIGEKVIKNLQTSDSGFFSWTAPANERYDYYFLSVFPVKWGDKYEVDTVQPGANGGEIWNDEYIRFDMKNLGDGWYGGNTFILKEKE